MRPVSSHFSSDQNHTSDHVNQAFTCHKDARPPRNLLSNPNSKFTYLGVGRASSDRTVEGSFLCSLGFSACRRGSIRASCQRQHRETRVIKLPSPRHLSLRTPSLWVRPASLGRKSTDKAGCLLPRTLGHGAGELSAPKRRTKHLACTLRPLQFRAGSRTPI